MEYTEEQKRAIEAQGRVIVSASAGSGKTKIMIERSLRLVLSGGASVSDLLAVTFTKKAAFQMRERLRAALLGEIKKSAGETRNRLRAELDLLGVAEISTVHSFCGRLIRTYFYLLPETDIPPDYRILTPQDAAGIKSKAFSSALESAFEKGGESFGRVLAVYYRGKKEKSLRAVVTDMYERAHSYVNGEELLARAGEDKFDEAANYLVAHYKNLFDRFYEELRKIDSAAGENKGILRVCGALFEILTGLSEKATVFEMAETEAVFPRMPARPREEGDDLERWFSLRELNEGLKKTVAELSARFADEHRERARYEKAARCASSIATLSLAYGREYARLKRETNALDYDDLEHFALALLEKEEVRAEVRKKYRYVFVDEYQDVNPLQERIVSLVAGENLFLVGDEKQAIYGFRGSRSRYFREKREEFGGAYPLTENFRSANGVLSAVNDIFAPVVTGYEPMRGGRLYAGNEGGVFSHKVVKLKEEKTERGIYSVMNARGASKKNALAEAVVRVVESEKDGEFFDVECGKFRKIGYGDIAVLVRKDTTDGKRIAAALTGHGIPVTTSSRVNVCDFFETKLLIDCLRFLDNKEADIPLAAVMLSSIGGFSDEDLMRIRLKYFDKKNYAAFRAAARAYAEAEKDELSHRLNVFFRKAKRWRALSKVRTAAEVLNGLLAEGLEVEIASKDDGRSRIMRVRRFVAEAEKCGSVHEFLSRLKETDEEVNFSESGGENAVRVLTMHASKGLEFPVAILASMETLLHGSDADEVEWSEKFLFSPRCYDEENKLYYETVGRYATAAERAVEEEEGERNLLYVAMTRAKYRLHLMVEERKRAPSPAFFKRFSDYLGDRYKGEESGELASCVAREAFDFENALSETEKEQVLSVMRIGEEYPYRDTVYLPQKSSATALMKEKSEREEPKKVFHAGGSADEGTAYHKFLQFYRFGADVVTELSRLKREGIFTEKEAARLDPERLENIAKIPALAALAEKRVEREKKFLLSLAPEEAGMSGDGGRQIIFQGAIDVLFQDENGYAFYDYKYSGLDAAEIKEKYRPQIELYKTAIAKGKRVDRATVRAKIVNIKRAEEIDM